MAELRPFSGIMYNTDHVTNVSEVISLPYDKISKEQLEAYLSVTSYNIANVILGQDIEGDSESYNKYTRANDYMQDWMEQGVLKADSGEQFYIYEEEYTIPETDTITRRTALVAMVLLEEFDKKVILPHERTLASPKADRLKLMQNTSMNFGQIFGLFKDSEQKTTEIMNAYKQGEPYLDAKTNEEGVRHRLWNIDKSADIQVIQQLFEDKQIYIADGHHRYTTAINYRDELRAQGLADDSMANYRLMSLVDIEDEGMNVLPTHRIVNGLQNLNNTTFLNKLSDYFEMETFVKHERGYFLDALNKDRPGYCIGLSLHDDDEYYLLTLKDSEAVEQVMGQFPDCIRSLDVAILHQLILYHIMGMTEEDTEKQTYLTYERSVEQALNLTNDGDAQATFVLRPTAVEQVLNVADASEYMPQKSTDFFPKLYTGIVMARIVNPVAKVKF